MYTFFIFKIAVGILALDEKCRALYASLGILLHVYQLGLEAFLLAPSRIHPEKHLCPVLRVCAAGACVHRNDRVVPVVLAVEQRPEPQIVQCRGKLRTCVFCFLCKVFVLLFIGHLDHDFKIFKLSVQALELRKLALDGLLFFHILLRTLGIIPIRVVPEVAPVHFVFYFFESFLEPCRVKGTHLPLSTASAAQVSDLLSGQAVSLSHFLFGFIWCGRSRGRLWLHCTL